MPREIPVVGGCLLACDRLAAVARIATEHGAFALAGPHLRHALDHLLMLLDGLSSGCVDYAARARDDELERDPETFGRALAAAREDLLSLSRLQVGSAVDVHDVVSHGLRQRVPSSVARELAFVASHAIHHLALVRATLARHGMDVPVELCTAFSTEDHDRELALRRERVS